MPTWWKAVQAVGWMNVQRRCWALLFRCWLLPLLNATRFQTSPEVLQTWGRSACPNLACSTSYLQRNKACYRENTGILLFSAAMQCLCQCARLWCEDLVNAERKDVLRHKVDIAAIVRRLLWPPGTSSFVGTYWYYRPTFVTRNTNRRIRRYALAGMVTWL